MMLDDKLNAKNTAFLGKQRSGDHYGFDGASWPEMYVKRGTAVALNLDLDKKQPRVQELLRFAIRETSA